MSSLYRKYRPKTFAQVVGQEVIKKTLQQELATGMISHAYLFCGPRAVGKTTTARLFVRALNCQQRKKGAHEPCNACDACSALLANKTLDVMEIDAASHTGVDNVRETIIAASRVGNTFLQYKAFIIDEVHMLSTSAFNALLKTLEEPPSGVIFILATTEIHKVPLTIISRCQRFDFKLIGASDMKERLKGIILQENREVSDEVLDHIVRLSQGCQRDAESLLGQVLAVKEKKIDSKIAQGILAFSHQVFVDLLVNAVISKDQQKAFEIIAGTHEQGVDSALFIQDCVSVFRDVLHVKIGVLQKEQYVGLGYDNLSRLAKSIEPDKLLAIIDFFMEAHREKRWIYLEQLPLEIAVVKSCSI